MSKDNKTPLNILILQKDRPLLDLMIFSIQSEFGFKIHDFQSMAGTNEVLEKEDSFSLLILDARLKDMDQSEFLKRVIEKNKNIPIFLTNAEGVTPENENLFQAVIKTDDLLEEVNSQLLNFFKIDETAPMDDYTPVAMRTLTALEGLNDDVFIQLKTGRFLKIFRKGDKVDDSDVDRFSKKGVEFLFLDKETARWILNEINRDFSKNLQAILNNKKLDLSSAAEIKEVRSDIEKKFKFDKGFKKKLSQSMKSTLKKITKNPKLDVLLKRLKVNRDKGGYFGAHISLLCHISCGIAKLTDWGGQITLEKLVFISHLHDLSLSEFPHLAEINSWEDFEKVKEQLSEEEKDIWHSHPEDSASLARGFPGCPPEADSIILQHHERPDGSGFPYKINSSKLSPLSSLFIVAHDLVDYIYKNPQWTPKLFLVEYKSKYSGPNFKKIIRAIEKM